MFGNNLMSVSNLVRKAALAVIIGLTFAFIGVAAVYMPTHQRLTMALSGVSVGVLSILSTLLRMAPARGTRELAGPAQLKV